MSCPTILIIRDLFVTQNEEGEEINFLLTSPKTPEDLLRRRECYINGVRSGGGVMVHCMGADALAAFTVAAKVMDREIKTHYTERVENYRKLLQKQDLAITGAITDVKGDRSLHRLQAETAPGLLSEDRGPAERRHRGPGGQGAYQRHPLRQ